MSTPKNGPSGLIPPTSGPNPEFKPYVCLECGRNYANPNPEPLDIPAYCPDCISMHEKPSIKGLADDMYEMGLEHGVSRVIRFFIGALDKNHPALVAAKEHFQWGVSE